MEGDWGSMGNLRERKIICKAPFLVEFSKIIWLN